MMVSEAEQPNKVQNRTERNKRKKKGNERESEKGGEKETTSVEETDDNADWKNMAPTLMIKHASTYMN